MRRWLAGLTAGALHAAGPQRAGATGAGAKALQDALNIISGSTLASGAVDAYTTRRLIQVQRMMALTPGGICGPRTVAVLAGQLEHIRDGQA